MLKFSLLSYFLLLSSLTIFAQISSSCNSSPTFDNSYYEDVQELAIMDMLASNSSDTGSVGVIPSYSQDVLRALAAVANTASPSNEADSIFNLYCIHNNREVNRQVNYELLVSLDPTVPWTSNWLNLTTPSGNTAIDNLLAGQAYSIRKPFTFLPNLIELTFTNLVNIKPLKQLLTGMSGVNYAETTPLIGDGNYISHSKVGNTSYLDFSLGWDDCSSGCIRRRVWSYSVDLSTCTVTYLGATGDPTSNFSNGPASQASCNILLSNPFFATQARSLQVYPNPSSNLLYVAGDIHQVKLYNTLGTLLIHTSNPTALESLDISHLPKGVYVLVVNEGITRTVVKE